MLMRYRPAVDSFAPQVTNLIYQRFNLPGVLPLFDELHERGYGQADLCLELLHMGLIPEVEVLIGKPIERGPPPPSYLTWIGCSRAPARARGPDDRTVQSVVRNPRLPTTPSFQRFREFRVGASIAQLLQRGVTRRDIREAVSNQWVVFV